MTRTTTPRVLAAPADATLTRRLPSSDRAAARGGILAIAAILCSALTGIARAEAPAASPSPALPDLVIYTYDSFMAKGGLGRELVPRFEKQCGCRVRAIPAGDGAQVLTRLELDRKRGKPVAHVAVGIDQHLWMQAREHAEAWGRWQPARWNRVRKDLRRPELSDGFLPFDFGAFALMADTEGLKKLKLEAPRRMTDLLKPEYRRNLILEDPRTSTPGLAFLLFADSLGGDASGFWKKMKGQWLTLAPGWDAAYGLFLKGEAPLVWSYVTSQAYHEEHGDSAQRYRALVFEDGQPLQIEGAFLIKGNPHRMAQSFLEFLVSDEAQKLVARTNWMMPALEGVELPPSFKALPEPRKTVVLTPKAGDVKDALSRWSRAVEGR